MDKRFSKMKRKLFPVFCSVFSLFSVSNQGSHASIITEFNNLLEVIIRFNALAATGGRQAKRFTENLKSRVCVWNPNLCPEIFYKNIPDSTDESEGSVLTFDKVMSLIQGREIQKEIVRKFFIEYTINLKNSEAVGDINNRAMMLNGPSGTGKSKMADIVTRFLVADGFDEYGPTLGLPTSILRVSSMDVDRNQKTSAWRQLLSDYHGDKGIGVISPFRKYLEENPNGGVIVLEEVDKWWSNDLQEGLRSLIDDGRISIDGEYINVRNYLIVMTANMCSQSLAGQPNPTATKEEIELGLTTPSTSKSFMNRLCILDFSIMSENELVDIFVHDLDLWNERNADTNASISLSDDARKYIGHMLFDSKQGARASKALFRTMLPKMYYLSKYAENHPDEFSSLVEFELVLNDKGNDLILKKKSDPAKSKQNNTPEKIESSDQEKAPTNEKTKSSPLLAQLNRELQNSKIEKKIENSLNDSFSTADESDSEISLDHDPVRKILDVDNPIGKDEIIQN